MTVIISHISKILIYIFITILIPGKTINLVFASEQNFENISTHNRNISFEQKISQSDSPNPNNSQLETPTINQENLPLTSVNQLADIQPTDWAFQALQSLIERYGCISGYPDNTFQGNHVLNRYEFAAAFSACLDTVNRMIQTASEQYATPEELEIAKRLQAEFAQELAKLRPKLQPFDDRITQLEKLPNFSTTSQLLGKTIFAVSSVTGNDINANVVFSHRTELNVDSSFTGKDRLRMRFLARNSTRFGRVTGTDMANLSFAGDSQNDVEISQLSYQFRATKKLQVFISTEGGSFTSFTNSLNSPISSSAIAHVSNFSDHSAIYELGGGVGAGIEYRFSDRARLSLGYMAGDKPNDPKQGIAGGEYGAIAQLTLRPTDKLSLGLTYIRAYNSLDTGKGSEFANDPFDGAATSANAYGIQTSYRFNQKATLSGWVGLIDAQAESSENKGDNAKILTWAATLGLNDIGGKGNLLGLVVGQPPKVIATDVYERKDPDTALHLEAFYRYRINDNMYITPGFYVIINPEHNAANDAIYVGTIRQTFLF
jgi:Carbohydrate-selective porin, OprB family/S-layer homology domain